jgi:Icc-related predicted phosphoesterase
MRIAATSDFDIPQFALKNFILALEGLEEPDVFLFAGDMYDYRRPKRYKDIGEILDKIGWNCPIIAIPGNHEFEEDYEKIFKYCGDRIKFIDDEAVIVKGLGIVGSRGALDQPTTWQSANVIGIKDTYSERILKIKKLLEGLKTSTKILLTHYAPSYATLEGESKRIYTLLGTRRLEKVMVDTGVTFAVHGHAHYGKLLGFVGKIPVFNVAFPVNQKIVIIDTDKLPKPGLMKFTKQKV